MQSDHNTFDIREGAEVVGTDGTKLGSVDRLEGNTIVVRKGFFFPQDHYIPVSAVTRADADYVHLSVTGDAAQSEDWGHQSETSFSGDVQSGTVTSDLGVGGMETDPQPFGHRQDSQGTHINAEDEILVPVVEEELAAHTREVEQGEVRIHKNIIEEQQSLEVPVTEEEVEITRRRVDRPVTDADHAFEEGTINVPLRGEEVDVQKRARVVEEIDLDKTAVTHTEWVTDTVHREEVRIDGDETPVRTLDGQGRGNGAL